MLEERMYLPVRSCSANSFVISVPSVGTPELGLLQLVTTVAVEAWTRNSVWFM